MHFGGLYLQDFPKALRPSPRRIGEFFPNAPSFSGSLLVPVTYRRAARG